jgi:Zinc dependent phospholipase C
MPASITHLIVQQKLKNNLNPQYKNLLKGFETNPYANFGSIGPDFLFFTVLEYGIPGTDAFLEMFFKFYDALVPLIEFKNEVKEKVETEIIAPIEANLAAIDETFFKGIFSDLKNTSALFTEALLGSMEKIVVNKVDFFYPFYPKIQQGCPENEWYWFDFLHYRRTGQFCSNMWQLANAENNDNLKRYCLGYASHIGTDIVGHSYVNAIVGGPYRNHWRRHKLTENWIDAYAKNHYSDIPEITTLLNLPIEHEDYISNSISGSNYYRLTDFKDDNNITRLPKDLGNLIINSLKMTYPEIEGTPDFINQPHPKMLDFKNLEQAYLTWQKWFKRTTTIGKSHRPVPVPPPGSAASSLINNYISNFPSLPSSGGSGGSGFSIHNITHNLANFLQHLVDVLDYTLNWIETNAANILLLPINILLETIKWLLYQLQKCLYEIAENARFIMVLCGYIYPEPEDLNHPQFGKAFLSPDFVGQTQGGMFNYSQYPLKQVVPVINCGDSTFSNSLITGNEYHLKYPTTQMEFLYTEPTSKPFTSHCMPESFIDGVFPFNNLITKLYSSKDPYVNYPAKPCTNDIDSLTLNNYQLGSALKFSQRLINTKMVNIPNFNLDSDRGYGWKCWNLIANQGNSTLTDNNPMQSKYIN